MSTTKFDAVITWVDGDDPEHAKKINAYKDQTGQLTINSSKSKTRFTNNGELLYCLKSIQKHAKWIDHIYIVTDSQTPSLDDEVLADLKITLIDHKDIFRGYEKYLPTFNSITIESMIHNIPGLAEQYLYFNDDFFILSKVTPQDFFDGDQVILRGAWKRIQNFNSLRIGLSQCINFVFKHVFHINRSMSLLQQMEAAKLAGFTTHYLRSPHYPHPQKKSTIKSFYEKNPEALNKNIQYRFRNLKQHVAIFLSNHLEIKKNNAGVINDDDCLMICFNRDNSRSLQAKIARVRSDYSLKFLCVQSLEEATSNQRTALLQALRERGL